MLAATGGYGDQGRRVLVIGLTQDDIQRMAGCPFHFDGDDLAAGGLPALEIIIVYGRTEGDIADLIRSQGVPIDTAPPDT